MILIVCFLGGIVGCALGVAKGNTMAIVAGAGTALAAVAAVRARLRAARADRRARGWTPLR